MCGSAAARGGSGSGAVLGTAISWVLLVLGGPFVPGPAAATVLNIEVPLADTTIRQRHPDSNYSDSDELRVSGSRCEDTSITLMLANLEVLSFDAVESAALTIVKIDEPSSHFDWAPLLPISLRPILSAWSPGEVTWSSQPEVGAAVVGLMVSAADPIGTVYEFDITELMNAWLAEEILNLGFAIAPDSSKRQSSGRYGSIDGQAWSAPALIVTPAPEPGTALLVGVGLGLMCLQGRS